MKAITKRYPGVLALDQVNFSVRAGEVHALLGENGAGKSTLMKILGGADRADHGEIFLNGKRMEIHSPRDGIGAGLNVVYQELVLAPHLTVAENILMGQLPIRNGIIVDWKKNQNRAKEVLGQLGVELDVSRTVRSLPVAQQQLVEIARALQRQSQILVLDEPSAVLGKHDIELLYQVIRRLKARGISVVYISHRLEEIFIIADRVTVLKDGKTVGTRLTSELDERTLVQMMIGRNLGNVFKSSRRETGAEVLRVEGLSSQGKFQDINFSLRSGEILGIAGLVGSGRTEVIRVIDGADRPSQGQVFIDGKRVRFKSPRDALSGGIGLLPEDRNREGLFLKRPLFENITISSLDQFKWLSFINLQKEVNQAKSLIRDIGIRTPSARQLAANLSGGNKQKVVLARWLGARCRVLIFDEPTRGVDVGAKVEIYRLMNELASQGVAIIMVSSEIPEVLGMSDTILVMWRGMLAATFTREEATREKILQAALLGRNNHEQ
jgi:ribose transport system ATP-binding protein